MAILDSSYRLVIIAHYMRSGILDREDEIYEADIYENGSEQLDSQITEQPLINGDTIADHMFREPMTKSFGGKFSLNGNKPTSFEGGYDRLANIQQTFEFIQKNGIFCTLICQNKGDSSKFRFLKRDNMVLKSITWNPGINTLGFTFNFREVIAVELIDIEEVDWKDEDNLPDITDASLGSFSSELLDTNEVLKIVAQTLADYKLIDNDFWTFWGANISQDWWKPLAIGAGVGAILLTLAGGLAATGPVGWLVIAAGAVVGFFVGLIRSWIEAARKAAAEKTFTKAFKLTKDEAKNIKECKRLTKYLADIMEQLESLNDVCSLYNIPEGDNQECMISIDNEYYIFKFTRNNTDNELYLDVLDQNLNNISSNNKVSSSVKSVNECNENNRLFITKGGFRAYIINCNSDATEFAVTDFKILVTQINMNDFSNVLKDLTINAMKKAS